ncbi:MAG TPA: MlaD family protein [Steroidobacteraceae bacterium]|nr:MlaD family protein [Steroidobacteraceae bacterium]
MTEPPAEEPQARVTPGRRLSLVWVIPVIAVAVVIGIGWRALAQRGPTITIIFDAAEGIQSGQTRIRRKDVDLGTVESVKLTKDLSRVIVRARMLRSATPYLNEHTQFWIVRPRVSAEGISGLSTLVSGVFIEMNPGRGSPQTEFTGLEAPPILEPDVPGRSFMLHASQLSSLNQGSAIFYRGLSVGQILGYALDQKTQKINIYAFVHAPYDRLVHPESRFWNASGVDVSLGAQGVHIVASSWQQLLSGGVEFTTPASALDGMPSPAGAPFRLYEDKNSAEKEPRGTPLLYRVDFSGAVSGIEHGSPVELLGSQIGQVKHVELEYDDRSHLLHTPVVIELDPTRVKVVNGPARSAAELAQDFAAHLDEWVKQGLRARLTSASFITGQKLVSLDLVADAAPARIQRVDSQLQIPSAPSVDVTQILQSVHRILSHIDRATAGPELSHAMKELDRTLTHLEEITRDVQPQIGPLINSLRQSAEAAQRTLEQAGNVLGSNAAQSTDLPRLMQELTDAARSVKALADYLDRHPEALIRGKKEDSQP